LPSRARALAGIRYDSARRIGYGTQVAHQQREGTMGAKWIAVAAAVGVVGSAGFAGAQGADMQRMAAAETTAPSTYDAARVQARMDGAHALAVAGRFGEALREYRAIADMQKRAGVLPADALWQAAILEHGRGGRHRLHAATMLDELAEQAAIYGDPALQARALIEAAILYQSKRRSERARSCMDRLEPLLRSPHVSAELRADIESRIRRT
jgi:hypothetical protein